MQPANYNAGAAFPAMIVARRSQCGGDIVRDQVGARPSFGGVSYHFAAAWALFREAIAESRNLARTSPIICATGHLHGNAIVLRELSAAEWSKRSTVDEHEGRT